MLQQISSDAMVLTAQNWFIQQRLKLKQNKKKRVKIKRFPSPSDDGLRFIAVRSRRLSSELAALNYGRHTLAFSVMKLAAYADRSSLANVS